MLTLNKEFEVYDKKIRPEDGLLKAAQWAHLDVRTRLNRDEDMKKILVADFLQGSYARYTMTKPTDKADVDIIVVTTLHEDEWTPEMVLKLFEKWLIKEYGEYDKNGNKRVEKNGRSVNLKLDDIEIDLVPTSAPSEAVRMNLRSYAEASGMQVAKAVQQDDTLDPNEVFGPHFEGGDWTEEPLRIPDTHAQCWQDTHPLATLAYTREKNHHCGKLFLRIVRAVKWWRKRVSGGPDHPKSYPVEHMVGDACPEGGFKSVAEGVALTLALMVERYKVEYQQKRKPILPPRGLEHSDADVLALLEVKDFLAFYETLKPAAGNAAFALTLSDPHEAGKVWQRVLGKEFPVPPSTKPSGPTGGGYPTPKTPDPRPESERFG